MKHSESITEEVKDHYRLAPGLIERQTRYAQRQIDADLALDRQRLLGDRTVGSSHKHISAEAET